MNGSEEVPFSTIENVEPALEHVPRELQGAAPTRSERRHGAQRGAAAMRESADADSRAYHSLTELDTGFRGWNRTVDEIGKLLPAHAPTRSLGTPETQWRPTNIAEHNMYSTEQIQMQMVQTMERIVSQMNALQPSKPAEELDLLYSGRSTEDPVAYINKLEDHFFKNQIPSHKFQYYFKKTLTAEAATWYRDVLDYPEDWEVLKCLFLAKYNSVSVRSQLLGELYGRTQLPTERSQAFVIKKWSLFRRLAPNTPYSEKLSLIQELLKPSIRAYTRGLRFNDLNHILEVTTQIEQDLGSNQANRQQAQVVSNQANRQQAQSSQRTPVVQLQPALPSPPVTQSERQSNPRQLLPPPAQAHAQPPNPNAQQSNTGSNGVSTARNSNENATRVHRGRPCRHCGGPHYDNQCRSRRNDSGNSNRDVEVANPQPQPQ